MISRMFKTPGHQRYNYKPRYYDPKKEELEEKMKKAKSIKEGDKAAIKSRISSNMRRYKNRKTASQQTAKANARFGLIALILAIILFYGMQQYMPYFDSMF